MKAPRAPKRHKPKAAYEIYLMLTSIANAPFQNRKVNGVELKKQWGFGGVTKLK
jgi:hypothetical protein